MDEEVVILLCYQCGAIEVTRYCTLATKPSRRSVYMIYSPLVFIITCMSIYEIMSSVCMKFSSFLSSTPNFLP